MKMGYYGSFLSLADVNPNNSYGWEISFKKGSVPSFLISVFGAPHLGARIRHRMLTKILGKRTKNISVFDVGCGFGLESLYLRKGGYQVFGIDKSEAKIAIAKRLAVEVGDKKVTFKAADIFKFSGTKNKFDIAILFEVLEHVKNPQEMLSKISSFIKPGGKIIISFPAKHWINARSQNYLGHEVVGYRPSEIEKFVKPKGLMIKRIYSYGNSFWTKIIFYIDYILLRFIPLASAAFFFLSYPFVVFDQRYSKSETPTGYVLVIEKNRYQKI